MAAIVWFSDVPGWADQQSPAALALLGALTECIIRQPSPSWPALLAGVVAGEWTAAIELVDDDDGQDVVFAPQIQTGGGWETLSWVERADLGLPRLDSDQAELITALGHVPDDAAALEPAT
jgi:hypothetical protein